MSKYFAFISYKRGGIDEKVANWIHNKLEKYPYPTELVRVENRPEHDSLIRNIFIDSKDLDVKDSDFSDEIKDALENSRYLIVVCSKLSAESKYVNDEIEYFLNTHEQDSHKILPVFIDTVEAGLPPVLRKEDILTRHCPIYNSFLAPSNEINLYCFYHVVAFLLKVDFRSIYDRYKRYSQKKARNKVRLRNSIYILVILAVVSLGYSVLSQRRLLEEQRTRINMEKVVFPYSVVTGYVNNFLSPVIEYVKANEPDAHIYVHMPTSSKHLNDGHRHRFNVISSYVTQQLQLDSLQKVLIKTSKPGGSLAYKMYSAANDKLNHSYIDIASTTSTFYTVALEKKKFPIYENESLDDMVAEYSNTFIRLANKQLMEDSTYVTFVTDLLELTNKVKDNVGY